VKDRRLLAPLGLLYGWIAAQRVARYRSGRSPQARLRGPVISVGNLSVGGSGKTPVVAHVATLLRDADVRVAILSRGYGGRFHGDCLVVSDGGDPLCDAATAGDEPWMLARDVPGAIVAVGPRRDVVGRAVEERFGRCVHVLDDGFQHLRLHRDLDLLCVGASDEARWPLPAGPLREFAEAARRADIVLLTRADSADEARLAALEERHGRERTLRVWQRPRGFFDSDGAPVDAPRRPFLVSGIAGPKRFEADVRGLCTDLAGHAVFRDHHAFGAAEIAEISLRARAAAADAFVTTAKDWVRWPQMKLELPVHVLRLGLEVQDSERLRERLVDVARSRRA
jgi:tetraacyldisaccharide 4'-kinase